MGWKALLDPICWRWNPKAWVWTRGSNSRCTLLGRTSLSKRKCFFILVAGFIPTVRCDGAANLPAAVHGSAQYGSIYFVCGLLLISLFLMFSVLFLNHTSISGVFDLSCLGVITIFWFTLLSKLLQDYMMFAYLFRIYMFSGCRRYEMKDDRW
jgi:hypothetical protein